ncbi:MAG: PEP-CTERM sorting domain-containing protein [Chlorobia bacterium]|nr:PEP-CTERM sorting domain-containing protein [Fimbriimonadaceae bacterium]
MNNRFLLVGAFVLAASGAHAAFTMTLDQPNQSIVLPLVSTDLIFTGTITKDEQGQAGGATTTIAFPALPSNSDYLSSAFNSTAYFTWVTTAGTTPFTGELFRVTVLPTSQLGLHDFNVGAPGNLPYVQVTYNGVTGNQYDSGRVLYTVNVTPVPEPATLCALGLGALALLRRKRS